MQELWDHFSDPDEILQLAPEELGARILFILKNRKADRKNFSPRNEVLSASSQGDVSRGITLCPLEYSTQVRVAVAEAFSWLECGGFIIPEPASDGGWYILTRRANSFESIDVFASHASASHLPKALIHSSLRDGVWVSFMRRDYQTAVFQAMRSVEISVREAAGFDVTAHGLPMLRKAFASKSKPSGPLVDPEQPPGEAEALEHLFVGALGSYKNPHSHRLVELNSPEEAAEIIILASHLLKIVDSRREIRKQGKN